MTSNQEQEWFPRLVATLVVLMATATLGTAQGLTEAPTLGVRYFRITSRTG